MRLHKFFILLLFSASLKILPIQAIEINNISEKPIFCNTLHWNLTSSEDICKIVTPLIKKHLKESNYDRFFLTLQYILHYESLSKQNPSLCPLQTLESFIPDLSLGELKGSSCFGLNIDLLSKIPPHLSVYSIPATLFNPLQQPYWPNYSHVAIVIPFCNPQDPKDTGYILLDPHLKIETPLILLLSGKPEVRDLKEKGIYRFFYKKGKIFCQKTNEIEIKDYCAIYYLTEFMNFVESSLKPILAADRKITLYSRTEEGKVIASLILMLDTNIIKTCLSGKPLKEIPFSDFLCRKILLEDDLAKGLHIEKEKLDGLVEKILLHKNLLDDLYHKYTNFVEINHRATDFYIPTHTPPNC